MSRLDLVIFRCPEVSQVISNGNYQLVRFAVSPSRTRLHQDPPSTEFGLRNLIRCAPGTIFSGLLRCAWAPFQAFQARSQSKHVIMLFP